ncbi:LysE family translocator [Psychromonas sp. Urea-02u-13]|uniref:LysE family translocator n=1 Tax=Psychromonas sp. Urea-02u-13 TaxID=2058326 RepID=UPI000C32E70A|nr:LysE family translocator [Psychromonas sp. Urea-02u-13]PKG37762.1 homoserine lactone transporter [Psychromonas sp. Urea-02u-13]
MNEILTFSLVALLLVISPGPNGVLIIKTVSAEGKKPAFFNILGLTVATFFHGAFSILGLSAVLLQSAELFLAIKIMGAMYLLFIGLKAIYQTFKQQPNGASNNTSNNTLNNKTDEKNSPQKKRPMSNFFVEGFLTQILNPKVSMFYLAAFPQFLSFDQPSAVDAFVLVAIHASIIFLWFTAITKTISKLKFITKMPALGKWVQRVSGAVMVYFGGLLLMYKS